MTECQWVAQHVDAYELGELSEADSARLERHVACCQACRELLAAVRSTDEALRSALEWSEPDAAFARRITASARVCRRWRAAAAAAAAVVCLAVVLGTRRPPPPAASVALGELWDPFGRLVERVEPSHRYAAATDAVIDLGDRAVFLIEHATQFACAPDPADATVAMTVFSGMVLAQIEPRRQKLTVELGTASVRTSNGQFYARRRVWSQALRGWGVLPVAFAQGPEEVRLHVFDGEVELDLGVQKLTLSRGESCILSSGVSSGSSRSLRQAVKRLREAIGEDVIAMRARYARLCSRYAGRLENLRGARGTDAPPYRGERIRLLEQLLPAHARVLDQIEARHAALFELEAAEAELERLDEVRTEADAAWEQLVVLLGSPGYRASGERTEQPGEVPAAEKGGQAG